MFGVFNLKILAYQFYIADYFKDQILKHIQKTRYYHILEQIKQTSKTRD